MLTFTSSNPDAAWYSNLQGFLGTGENIQYSVTQRDTVYLTIPSSLDCSENKAWVIEVEELEVEDVIGCIGDLVTLEASTRFDSVSWQFRNSMDVFMSKSVEFELLSNDSIFITAYLDNCVIKDSIAVTISQPELSLASEQYKIFAGDNIQLSASGGLAYSWSPSDGFYAIDQ